MHLGAFILIFLFTGSLGRFGHGACVFFDSTGDFLSEGSSSQRRWNRGRGIRRRMGGVIKGSVGNNCLRQIEFRVVFHPSAHLFLGICNGSLHFVFRGLVFFSKIPKCDSFMT